jgi:chromosome segregation ATPase
LTSPYERPDRAALDALVRTVGALEEELAAWRKRSQKADLELGDLRKGVAPAGPELAAAKQKITALEGENQGMRRRIAAAREELEALRVQLRFVEQRGAGDAA